MTHYSIKVAWSEKDGMFAGVCPVLGGISALGKTAREAVAELEKAIDLALETYAAEGWPVPDPDVLEEHSGQFRLRLPRSMHAWLAHEAERQGVSLNTMTTALLARAMGAADARVPAPARRTRKKRAVAANAVRERHSAVGAVRRRA
jgi:predicted RNase H-like HicB family nuclease